MTRFAIIGYGEVGRLFARDLLAGGSGPINVFDISAEAAAAAGDADGIAVQASATDAAASADIVFVCVTAGSVLDAMTSLHGGLSHRPMVVDINSVSPATKCEASRRVAEAGGRYVEVSVMASAPARGLRTPMLVGGPDAESFLAAMAGFGLDAQQTGEQIGRAAAIKMCRSVMIKGIEALTAECVLASRYYDIEADVMQALSGTLGETDWAGQARSMLQRSVQHGRRRAEEMREVALTVAEAGVEPMMSSATARRQDWAAGRTSLLSPSKPDGHETKRP